MQAQTPSYFQSVFQNLPFPHDKTSVSQLCEANTKTSVTKKMRVLETWINQHVIVL